MRSSMASSSAVVAAARADLAAAARDTPSFAPKEFSKVCGCSPLQAQFVQFNTACPGTSELSVLYASCDSLVHLQEQETLVQAQRRTLKPPS